MVTRPEPCAAAARPALRLPPSCQAHPGVQGTGLALFPAPGRGRKSAQRFFALHGPPFIQGACEPGGAVRALTARAGMHECPLGAPGASEPRPCALLAGAPGPRMGPSGRPPPPGADASAPGLRPARPRNLTHLSPSQSFPIIKRDFR